MVTSENKIHNPSQIDKLIRADPTSDLLGYNIVTEFMIHGPCDLAKTNAACMKNSMCSKMFPKQIKNKTTIDENGIINHKRSRQIAYQIR